MNLLQKTVDVQKWLLGEEHPSALKSMHNLAFYYSDLGRKKEAMSLLEKTVDARKRTLGEEHLSTLNSMHNLALDYSDLGRNEDAVKLAKTRLTCKTNLGRRASPYPQVYGESCLRLQNSRPNNRGDSSHEDGRCATTGIGRRASHFYGQPCGFQWQSPGAANFKHVLGAKSWIARLPTG